MSLNLECFGCIAKVRIFNQLARSRDTHVCSPAEARTEHHASGGIAEKFKKWRYEGEFRTLFGEAMLRRAVRLAGQAASMNEWRILGTAEARCDVLYCEGYLASADVRYRPRQEAGAAGDALWAKRCLTVYGGGMAPA
jgi:hypothetical protein